MVKQLLCIVRVSTAHRNRLSAKNVEILVLGDGGTYVTHMCVYNVYRVSMYVCLYFNVV
jgi:hypothetical protein